MFRQRSGQTLVEYGLLLALIAIIVIVAIVFLDPIVSNIFANQQAISIEGSPAPSLELEGSEGSPPQQIVVDGYTYELVESPSPQSSDE